MGLGRKSPELPVLSDSLGMGDPFGPFDDLSAIPTSTLFGEHLLRFRPHPRPHPLGPQPRNLFKPRPTTHRAMRLCRSLVRRLHRPSPSPFPPLIPLFSEQGPPAVGGWWVGGEGAGSDAGGAAEEGAGSGGGRVAKHSPGGSSESSFGSSSCGGLPSPSNPVLGYAAAAAAVKQEFADEARESAFASNIDIIGPSFGSLFVVCALP